MNPKSLSVISASATAESIAEADKVLALAIENGLPVIALPNEYSIHSLEKFYKKRLVPRGSLNLALIADFVREVQVGHSVFINRDSMTAVTYYDEDTEYHGLGRYENSVTLTLKPTPEKIMFERFKKPVRVSQQEAAELFEDYSHLFLAGELNGINIGRVLRKTQLSATQKSDHTVSNLSATKSTLESIEAKAISGDELPNLINCKAKLFENLPEFDFVLRLGVIKQTHAVEFVLSVICWAELMTEAAKAFVEVLNNSGIKKENLLVGTFSPDGKN